MFGQNTFKAPFPNRAYWYWDGLTVAAYDVDNPTGPTFTATLAGGESGVCSWEEDATDVIAAVRRVLRRAKDDIAVCRKSFRPLFRHAAK